MLHTFGTTAARTRRNTTSHIAQVAIFCPPLEAAGRKAAAVAASARTAAAVETANEILAKVEYYHGKESEEWAMASEYADIARRGQTPSIGLLQEIDKISFTKADRALHLQRIGA